MRAWQWILLCALALLLWDGHAYAGAWTQPAGQGLAIVTASDYATSSYLDNQGTRQQEARYRQYSINPYFEYGLTDGLTAGANISLQYASQAPYWHVGIGDSELFLRKRLWEGKGFIFSAEPMIKLPSPASPHSLPVLGGTHPDAGMGLNGGYGFRAYGLDHFVNIDTQYRERLGAPKNQARLNATLGIGLTPQWMLLPQAFITRRMGTPHTTTFTQSSADDYNSNKYQLSAVYRMNNGWSLQGGGYVSASGKNTGAGNGLLFAVWRTF